MTEAYDRSAEGAVSHRAGEDLRRLVQELQIRLIELEMQNEALRQSRQEAETVAQRYANLYDVVALEKDRLSALLGSITDEIWFADTEGNFTLSNPSASQEFNLVAASAISVRQLAESLEVFRPDGTPRPVEEAPPLRALRGEVVQDLEEIIRTPARGELRHRQVSASPVRDAGGNIIGSVCVVRDITDRKLAEQALRKAHDDLEQRVAERTAELAETIDELNNAMRERIRAEQSLQHEHQTLRRLLQATDRQRQAISLEIHDNLAQPLTSATMHLEAASGMKGRNSKEAAKAQAAGLAMLRASIDEARRLISSVRPPILEDEGIEAAIAHLAYEYRAPDAPRVEFHIDAAFDRLEAQMENGIYRIVQECLANACKHSRSTLARIELRQEDSRLRIEVRDWGVGFDPQQITESCFGLEEIRERARLLGGSAAIESAPGQGTRIVVDLPLQLGTPA